MSPKDIPHPDWPNDHTTPADDDGGEYEHQHDPFTDENGEPLHPEISTLAEGWATDSDWQGA